MILTGMDELRKYATVIPLTLPTYPVIHQLALGEMAVLEEPVGHKKIFITCKEYKAYTQLPLPVDSYRLVTEVNNLWTKVSAEIVKKEHGATLFVRQQPEVRMVENVSNLSLDMVVWCVVGTGSTESIVDQFARGAFK